MNHSKPSFLYEFKTVYDYHFGIARTAHALTVEFRNYRHIRGLERKRRSCGGDHGTAGILLCGDVRDTWGTFARDMRAAEFTR